MPLASVLKEQGWTSGGFGRSSGRCEAAAACAGWRKPSTGARAYMMDDQLGVVSAETLSQGNWATIGRRRRSASMRRRRTRATRCSPKFDPGRRGGREVPSA